MKQMKTKILLAAVGLVCIAGTAMAVGQELIDCCGDGWWICCWVWQVLEGLGF